MLLDLDDFQGVEVGGDGRSELDGRVELDRRDEVGDDEVGDDEIGDNEVPERKNHLKTSKFKKTMAVRVVALGLTWRELPHSTKILVKSFQRCAYRNSRSLSLQILIYIDLHMNSYSVEY